MWLGTLDRIINADLAGKIVEGGTLEKAVRLLSGYRGIDDFTGQQYATDFSYTPKQHRSPKAYRHKKSRSHQNPK
jgi:hypothetical protein